VKGVVVTGTGGVWRVRTEGGETVEASLRGRLKKADMDRRADGGRKRDTVAAAAGTIKLAVGDEVVLERNERDDAWAIADILPRRSQLARRSPGGGVGERVLAANVDQVVVVFAAAKPEPHPRMLDRFLVIVEANELAARIVVNKVDLVGEASAAERFADYARAGYPLHLTSVRAAIGLEPLREALNGRTSVFTGPSGVGKSSLLNGLYPGLNLRVGEISESVNKGRHTTVGGFAHPLPSIDGGPGGFVVDTPGLREVGFWRLDVESLASCFPEMRAPAQECRFADCAHLAEPGCGVREAVAKGAVSRARYESYVKLREEMEGEDPVYE
jgi:ribosome biogenesis GTPase